MPRRNVFLIVICLVVPSVFLFVPSFTARAIVAGLLLLVLAILLARVFTTRSRENESRRTRVEDEKETSQETFALGKLFDATMNGMREGLLVVDQDMRVVASNNAALRLFNPARETLETQRLTEITRNPAIYSAFLDALQGTERSGVKVETHGPERVFDLRVVPLGVGANGNRAEGALGVFIDITRIERLEHVRQEFLSNVSHELRTPLTAILAFVETLETSALDDKDNSLRFLSIVRRNASRMHDLIDDILELSAIEAGNVKVNPEPVELRPIVSDVINLLQNGASARGIVLENKVASDAMVLADARRLEQMLMNLVENAIKFNREDGTVKIRLERDNANGRDRIQVEDTGEGIPSQHLERLFERFYRVDRARSRDMGGTGLGLAIVKHLARAHGGEVSVTSELGKGTTFTIELPVAIDS